MNDAGRILMHEQNQQRTVEDNHAQARRIAELMRKPVAELTEEEYDFRVAWCIDDTERAAIIAERTGTQRVVSFRQRQIEDLPPRVWFVDGMITPGFNMLTGKKSQGKSFFLQQMANAIAEGKPFLGRNTTKTKVLLVSFELDDGDTHERFASLPPLSENAFLTETWPAGEKGLKCAERMLADFKVLIFDTFLPMLPQDGVFKLNEYGDSGLYLTWRRLAKSAGAAIVAAWHEGKSPRDDFMLNPIGSTGMVAQADSIISIDRKRGEAAGKLLVGGNHAADAAIAVRFENGLFTLAEGAATMDSLTRDEEKTLSILADHPEGCSPSVVAVSLGKSDHAAVVSLNRLIAREKAVRIKRGLYGKVTSHNSSQLVTSDNAQSHITSHPPKRGCDSGDNVTTELEIF